ncbi:LIM domain-binding protein 3 [Frankliniella fusca]|uniref:LIM domain-binding protein 3 n=1 Tax=Frankliniella fusca TaxID=407009 RepID=A0AAE1LPG3_9NEOP|nr:LIM domain-binding protein 3 [Frankliniella fusca]
MQVSYSTSPPPPLWPTSSSTAAPVETKVVEVIEKTPEARSLFEQQERERESRLRGAARVDCRIPGLSAFQQRVAQVGLAAQAEEPPFSSLTERRGLSVSQPPSLPAGLGLESSRERDVLRHFDEEMSTISLGTSLTASDADGFSGSPDSLEAAPASAVTPCVRTEDASPMEEKSKTVSGPGTPECAPDTGLDTLPTSPEPPAQTQARAIGARGKSTSLGSIESFGPAASVPPAQTPPLKASSSDSISGKTTPATHQITIPLGTSGLSITQRVEEPAGERERAAAAEPHCVTVACVPDPGITPTPAPATTSPTPAAAPAPAPTPTSTPLPPTVTLVNLPSPTVSLTTSPTLPDKPTSQNDTPDKQDKDKTEKLDLPAEPVQSAVVEQPARSQPACPEFMRVQLNRVDSKPSVNVVLSTAGASGPERGSRGSLGVIDPWSVEEVVDAAAASAPVSLLGLRVKRAVSKDDVAQAGQLAADVPAPVPATVASSVPGTPLKAQPLQKSASASVVPQSLIRKQPPPAKRMLSEDNNNVIIVEKKDKKDTPSPAKASPSLAQEDVAAAARRKSSSRDSLQLQWQSSLEDKEQRSRDSSISPVLDGVVLRKKSLPREGRDARDDTPELMKVFARRSLKVRDSEVELTLSTLAQQSAQGWESNGSSDQTPPQTPPHTPPQVQQRASRDSDKENEGDCGDSPKVERVSASLASRFQRSTAADEPEGSPEVGAPASTVPKFKRIQQRKEEWEQRAKALQRATQ